MLDKKNVFKRLPKISIFSISDTPIPLINHFHQTLQTFTNNPNRSIDCSITTVKRSAITTKL